MAIRGALQKTKHIQSGEGNKLTNREGLLLSLEQEGSNPDKCIEDDDVYDIFARLSQSEMYWRDHYDFLLSRGYKLRPRYHPDWVASWTNTNTNYLLCEDSVSSIVSEHSIFFFPS